jgi:hypothetical protein
MLSNYSGEVWGEGRQLEAIIELAKQRRASLQISAAATDTSWPQSSSGVHVHQPACLPKARALTRERLARAHLDIWRGHAIIQAIQGYQTDGSSEPSLHAQRIAVLCADTGVMFAGWSEWLLLRRARGEEGGVQWLQWATSRSQVSRQRCGQLSRIFCLLMA